MSYLFSTALAFVMVAFGSSAEAGQSPKENDTLAEAVGLYGQVTYDPGGLVSIFWDSKVSGYRAELLVYGGNEHICGFAGDISLAGDLLEIADYHHPMDRHIENDCTVALRVEDDMLSIVSAEPSGINDHCRLHCGARAHFKGVKFRFKCRNPVRGDAVFGDAFHAQYYCPPSRPD